MLRPYREVPYAASCHFSLTPIYPARHLHLSSCIRSTSNSANSQYTQTTWMVEPLLSCSSENIDTSLGRSETDAFVIQYRRRFRGV